MSGLHDYINYKYCNPEQPQNFTIKYSNDRSKYVSIRDQNVWKRKDKDAVMNELYDRDNDETLTLTQDQILKFFKNIKF